MELHASLKSPGLLSQLAKLVTLEESVYRTAHKNNYFAEQEVSNEVAIRHNLLDGSDLFLIADQVNTDGSVDLKVLEKPLVNLIWLAGLVFVGGSLITLWPDAREERRLAERYAGAFAEAWPSR